MHEDDIKTRSNETKKVGIIGIIGNIFLFIIKITIALISKSQAMIADTLNSGTDILSSLMTFICGKISAEPSDNEHNYGHGKAEYIFTMIISLITISLSFKIALDGINTLINKNEFVFSMWLIIVCIINIIIKLGLYIYAHKIGEKNNNILILANAQDHINDVFITSSVLISVLAAKLNIYWLDGIVAIGIVIRIAYVGVRFFLDSYNVLMDVAMKDGEKQIVYDIIQKYGEVDHIDSITSKSVGNKFIVIVKISIDENMTVKQSHNIAGMIKSDIMKLKDVYDVIVHVNPV